MEIETWLFFLTVTNDLKQWASECSVSEAHCNILNINFNPKWKMNVVFFIKKSYRFEIFYTKKLDLIAR